MGEDTCEKSGDEISSDFEALSNRIKNEIKDEIGESIQENLDCLNGLGGVFSWWVNDRNLWRSTITELTKCDAA